MPKVIVTITDEDSTILERLMVEVDAVTLAQMGLPDAEVSAAIAVGRIIEDSPFLAVLE